MCKPDCEFDRPKAMDKTKDQNLAKHREASLASESTISVVADNAGRPQSSQDVEKGTDSEAMCEDVERLASSTR